MTRRRSAPVVLLLLLVALPVSLSAQRVTRRVFVEVTSATTPVLDLAAADFALVENGVKREVTRAGLGKAPMRIVLLIDSSTPVAQMLNNVRPALTTFLDTLPPEHEVAFITTGGQIRIRAQPTTDRTKLKTEAGRFSSDGGGNSFIETLLESDRRFLRPVAQWPVFVIMTTDNGESRGEPPIQEYNRFLDDFLRRGGSAHGVVVKGNNVGHITDVAENLIQNTGGQYDLVNMSNILEEKFKVIAARLAADHQKLANAYEIDYTSDAKINQPQVEVSTSRPNVTVRLSTRRAF